MAFTVDGSAGTPVPLDGSAHATYASSTLAPGPHVIAATYSGDSTYSASRSPNLTEIILGPPASIRVVSGSGQTAASGSTYTYPLVVIVKDAGGDPSLAQP
jgi:hypothetical protein